MKIRKLGTVCTVATLFGVALEAATAPQSAQVPENDSRVLNLISPGNLKGDLSFLASDTLAGRYTPSPGLDVAAEFIASQFRAAGLEPGGNQDYFQIANMVDRQMPKGSSLVLQNGNQSYTVPADSVAISDSSHPVRVDRAPVIVFPSRDTANLGKADLNGKAILVSRPDFAKMPREKAIEAYRNMLAFDHAVSGSKAAVEIVVADRKISGRPKLLTAEEAQRHEVPVVSVASDQLRSLLEHPDQATNAHVSIDIAGPEDRPVTLKNVVGILRGSDPQLKNTYVLLTAHYDHIGTIETGASMASSTKSSNPNDHIYNGANDDGSGTVSVIEIGRALAKLSIHPKRTLVFMTFFGEERGEIGSEYYTSHPLFPLSKTVADVNLEQVGRTDSTAGKQVNTASLTGYDYSGVTKYMEDAGRELGIKVYLDKQASDAYFTQSDNDAFARHGVPAHSLTVAFDYPDYHGLGDEWNKIDYDNMARVDRMIALGLIHMANNPRAPQWNAQNPKTAPFREAQQKQLGQ